MKKPNKFSVVIPVVSVLTIGSILPITSFAAETNGLPHAKTNLTHRMHSKIGADSKTHSPKKSKNKAAAGISASTDTKAGTDTSASTDIKAGTDTSASTDIKAGTDTSTSTDIKVGTDTSASTDIKAGTDTSTSTDIKAGTDTGASADIKAGTDTSTNTDSVPAIDMEQFKRDLITANEYMPPEPQSDGSRKSYLPGHLTNPATIDVTPSLENFKDVTATETKDITTADETQEATYENTTDLNQTHVTPSKTITNTDSFTYSNIEGAKLGIELDHTFTANVAIPDIGGAGQSTTEFSYSHTSSNTTIHTEEITLPSQTIVAAPHGTTHYLGKVQRVEFSGKTEGSGYLTGTIDTEQYFTYPGEEGHWNGRADDPRNVKEKLDIYDVFKKALTNQAYSGLPNYIELDNVNKRVILKQPITSTFTGKLGFKADAKIEFIPSDPNKPKVQMSLTDYQNPEKRAQLLK
ncbi:ETX/MTX2 family pore-forming toxin (plasmid) [Bacillus cereus]|uniref:ETX/MTX2 family pore-forming toxin n=1 Tax=Bacillus cereus TaxID=1396 RepID=UPI001F37F2D8|nr:ETX/MTX2 family pore-forming toxin [Bacillus cereus]UIJ69731.1 ETX/MTX2 family pore-forming toxin [Bacillus cereus]